MSKPKALLVMLVAVCAFSPALAGENVNFVLGLRSLDNDFEPVEDQTAIGGTFDWSVSDWPINLEAGLHYSTEDDEISGTDIDVEVSILELNFGVNKTWDVGGGKNIHPFVGGGLTLFTATVEVEGDDEDDTSLGLYGHGGIFWRLGESFNIGVEGRIVRGAEVDFGDESSDGEYFQTSLILGWGWE